mmetsp:Transcript_103/g.178  ORF Transcript_103/g.178 Transcript_103/m.178 type:complete len:154 (-) Transcript_103:108-569(-)
MLCINAIEHWVVMMMHVSSRFSDDNSSKRPPSPLHPLVSRCHPYCAYDAAAFLFTRVGDAVLLHPDTAHAAAPNLHPSNVRTMIYFRLRNARVYSREMCDRMRRAETVRQAWEDLPEIVKMLGPEKIWSNVHRSLVKEHQDMQKEKKAGRERP